MYVNFDTVRHLWPECVLVLMATWIIVVGGTVRPTSRFWWAMFAVGAYAVALFALFEQDRQLELWIGGGAYFSTGPLAVDCLGHGLRWMAVLMGLVLTLVGSGLADRGLAAEVLGALMLVVVGVMLAAGANELVFLFVSLELVSIPTYMLLFTGRRDRASAEAATKYFFLSILASALLLYGFSFLYGIAGTTLIAGTADQPGIREMLLAAPQSELAGSMRAIAPIALVLVFAGLGFKIAAVPFHFYAPDVFQGATNANAGLLAIAPKVAGIAALVRLLVVGFPPASDTAWRLAIVLAILSMTIGNVCALWQKNIRRLLAYSSIAHAGYMLIGLAVALAAAQRGLAESGGVAATVFYLMAYVITSLAVFAALAYLGSDQRQVSSVDELAGLGRARPLIAAIIAAGMFSLAGVPPLAGFWGKFTIFSSAVRLASASEMPGLSNWFAALAVIGAINAAIAAGYYLRVVAVMYFQPAAGHVEARGGRGALTATVLSAAMMLAVGFVPGDAFRRAKLAEQTAVTRSPSAPRLSALPENDSALPAASGVE